MTHHHRSTPFGAPLDDRPGPLQAIEEVLEWLRARQPGSGTGGPGPARAPEPLRAHRFGHGDEGLVGHGNEGDGVSDAEADVLAQFREQARELHEQLVHEQGIFVAEFLGATGSGKTRLIERLIERAPAEESIGVIVGDVAGDDDARRYRELGVQVSSVTTGKECHLDPSLVEDALEPLDLDALDTLYVENVGNMVCPADFPLGAQLRVLVVSTTEGDDVVRKHPLLVQAVDAAVVNKVDVAAAVGSDVDRMVADVAEVAPELPVFRTSAEAGDGLEDLDAALAAVRAAGHAHGHGEHEHRGGEHRDDDPDHEHGHRGHENGHDHQHSDHDHVAGEHDHHEDHDHPHAADGEGDPLAEWRVTPDPDGA